MSDEQHCIKDAVFEESHNWKRVMLLTSVALAIVVGYVFILPSGGQARQGLSSDADQTTQASHAIKQGDAPISERQAQRIVAINEARDVPGEDVKLSSTFERCMDETSGVTASMRDCNYVETARQDARLNVAYKAAMATRGSAEQVALRNAQRAWIKFRDAKSGEALAGGGTLDLIIADGAYLRETALRADELERIRDHQDLALAPVAAGKSFTPDYHACLRASGGEVSAVSSCARKEAERQDAHLNIAYKAAMAARELGERELDGVSLKAPLRDAQRLWIAYRDASCSEALVGRDGSARCRLDMTVQRAVELERIAALP